MKNSDLLAMNPLDLLDYLTEKYIKEIPEKIETIKDIEMVSQRMNELTNIRSYLMPLLSVTDIQLRTAKAKKTDKETIADMTSKRDVLKLIVDIIEGQISSLSRAATIRKQIFEEMKML